MKILGFGIDLERMERFDEKISKIDKYLIQRFLTSKEYADYCKITNRNGRVRFLSSHWTAKEAVYKAMGASNQPLHQIEISRLNNGHLVYLPFQTQELYGRLSITYAEGYCAAACVLIQGQLDLVPTNQSKTTKKTIGNQSDSTLKVSKGKAIPTPFLQENKFIEQSEIVSPTKQIKQSNQEIINLLTKISLETQKEIMALSQKMESIHNATVEKRNRYENSSAEKLYTRTMKINFETDPEKTAITAATVQVNKSDLNSHQPKTNFQNCRHNNDKLKNLNQPFLKTNDSHSSQNFSFPNKSRFTPHKNANSQLRQKEFFQKIKQNKWHSNDHTKQKINYKRTGFCWKNLTKH